MAASRLQHSISTPGGGGFGRVVGSECAELVSATASRTVDFARQPIWHDHAVTPTQCSQVFIMYSGPPPEDAVWTSVVATQGAGLRGVLRQALEEHGMPAPIVRLLVQSCLVMHHGCRLPCYVTSGKEEVLIHAHGRCRF